MGFGELVEKVLNFEGVGEEGKKLAKRLKDNLKTDHDCGMLNRLLDHIEKRAKDED